MKIVRNLTAMAAVAATLTIAAQARADTINFYLNQPECTNNCTTLPALLSDSSAVEVSVDLTSSTTATVEFIAPGSPGPSTIPTPLYINVNGSFSATVSIPGGVVGAGGFDRFGTMDLGTSANTAADVYIYLTAMGVNSWTDAADVLTPTTPASSIYPHGFEAEVRGSDAGYLAATPLPAALPLFVSGLGAIGLLGRRRKRKNTTLAAA